jgi:hypothetical protein
MRQRRTFNPKTTTEREPESIDLHTPSGRLLRSEHGTDRNPESAMNRVMSSAEMPIELPPADSTTPRWPSTLTARLTSTTGSGRLLTAYTRRFSHIAAW